MTDRYLKEVLAELLPLPHTHGQIFNVNFPGCPLRECGGILRGRTVSAGMIYCDSYRVIETLENGGRRLMVDGAYNQDAEPDTDFRAICDKFVSVGTVNNVGVTDR